MRSRPLSLRPCWALAVGPTYSKHTFKTYIQNIHSKHTFKTYIQNIHSKHSSNHSSNHYSKQTIKDYSNETGLVLSPCDMFEDFLVFATYKHAYQ